MCESRILMRDVVKSIFEVEITMKSNTTGSSVNVSKKQLRATRLEQAVCRTLESLESRVLMAAGHLDPSWSAGTGWVMHTQPPAAPGAYAPPALWLPGGVTKWVPAWTTWDMSLPDKDPETVIHDSVVDAGGRLIVVGEQMSNHVYKVGSDWVEYFDRDFYLARYNTDGSVDRLIDPNLSDIGNLRAYPDVTLPTQLDDRAFAVAIEPALLPDGVTPNPLAGQILLVGTNGAASLPNSGGATGDTIALARYSITSMGIAPQLDNIGVAGLPQVSAYTVNDVVIQAVGNTWKYLVVGSTYDNIHGQNFALWRFNNDGTLDATFGNGGTIVDFTRFPGASDDEIMAVAVQTDGKIVVTGYSDDSVWNQQDGHVRMIVARYTPNGTPDNSFGVNGFVEIGDVRAADARANALSIQKDGRIVVAGTFDKLPDVKAPDGSTFDTGLVVRLLANGSLDNTFGTAGRTEISDPLATRSWRAQRLAVQSDGKIVVGGELGASFALTRLTADGRVDTTYGNNDGTAIVGTLPTGFREKRLGNIGGSNLTKTYSYDTPSLVLGTGTDVDKAYIIGNMTPVLGDPLFANGGYVIGRVQSDNTRPAAKAQLTNIQNAGAGVYFFYVTFTDNTGIKFSTLENGNVVIVTPEGVTLSATKVGITAQDASDGAGNNRQFVVKYSITPPGGTWGKDLAGDPPTIDNGTYSLRLLPGQVKDIEGADAVPTGFAYLDLGNFSVQIIPPDSIAPVASSSDLATSMTVGGRLSYRFVVKFEDLTSNPSDISGVGGYISVASIIGNNHTINVRGPNGYMQDAKFISIDFATDGTPRNVTYAIAAPGSLAGRWSEVDNGTYIFSLNANQVADDYKSANYAQAAELGRLKVAIVPGVNVFPSAQITAQDANLLADSTTPHSFSILYKPSQYISGVSMDPTTIVNNVGPLQVKGSNGAILAVAFAGITDAPGGGYLVTYQVLAADGTWSLNDNATYTISVVDVSLDPTKKQITDTDVPVGNPLQAITLGTFVVSVQDKKPVATVVTYPVTVGTHGRFDVVISYSDDIAIKAGTLGLSNIVLKRVGDGALLTPYTFSVSQPGDGSPRVVTYSFNPIQTNWTPLNGTYNIVIQPNQVFDNSGQVDHFVGTVLAETVTIAVQPPQAQLVSVNSSLPLRQVTIVVHYTDPNFAANPGVDLLSVGAGNVELRGQNNLALVFTPSSYTSVVDADGLGVAVTYVFRPSVGAFVPDDSDIYNINLLASQVKDNEGFFAPAQTLGIVNITVPVDAQLPVAGIGVVSDVISSATTSTTFVVTFTDNSVIDASTLDSFDIVITGPNGFSRNATLVSVAPAGNDSPLVATYSLSAPLGGWSGFYDGVYTLSLLGNQVRDINGNYSVAAQLAQFKVDIAPKTAFVSQTTTTLGDRDLKLTMTFTDRVSVNYLSITASTLYLYNSRTGQMLNPSSVAMDVNANGMIRTATFTINAPGGYWRSADNGTYDVVIVGSGMSDTQGNGILPSTLSGVVTVNVVSVAPPTATLFPVTPVNKAINTYDFTVMYSDNSLVVSAASIKTGNILIIGPNGFSQVATLRNKSSLVDASFITATYRVTLPAGTSWVDGRYGIRLLANQITDLVGNSNTSAIHLGYFKSGNGTAGELDPTYGYGSGTTQQQEYVTPVWDNIKQQYAFWNLPKQATSGANTIQNVMVDGGGKIVTVGTTLGHHLFKVADDITIPDPKDPTKTIKVKVVDYIDNDIYIVRYSDSGAEEYWLSPGYEGSPLNPNGDRDYTLNSGAGNYPAANSWDLQDNVKASAIDPRKIGANAGSYVVAGINGYAGTGSLFLARYYPAGLARQLAQIKLVDSPVWSVSDVLVQPDGKIVVSGSMGTGPTGEDFVIWRFNEDFTLDATFGNGGSTHTNFRAYSGDAITGIALEPAQIYNKSGNLIVNPDAGKIIAIGYSDDSDWQSGGRQRMVLVRYGTDGKLDTTFGAAGFTEIGDMGSADARGTSVAIQPDGKLVVSGVFDSNPLVFGVGAFDTTIVARLNSDGTLDETFGARGRVFVPEMGVDAWVGESLTLDSSGKIYIAGIASVFGDTANHYASVLRLTADGRRDDAFGEAGFTTMYQWGGKIANDWNNPVHIVVGLDGKPVISANEYINWTTYSGVAPTDLSIYGNKAGIGLVGRLLTDNQAPSATLVTRDLTVRAADTTTIDFTVTYTDDALIDGTTVNGSELQVLGPDGLPVGTLILTGTSLDGVYVNGNSNILTATYKLTVPNDYWSNSSHNGNYTISLKANTVKDTAGLAVEGRDLGLFRVDVITPDTQAPTAILTNLPHTVTGNAGLTVGGRATLRFTITYHDVDSLVSFASLGDGDVHIVGPNGYDQLAKMISISTIGDAKTIAVTYSVAAPGGSWDPSDNGKYTIYGRAGEVSDTYVTPNFVSATPIADFNVAISTTVNVLPTAALQSPLSNISVTQGAIRFSVVYSLSVNAEPDAIIDIASITAAGGNAISVMATLTNGTKVTANATLMSVIVGLNGSAIATYSFLPVAGFIASANGNYIAYVVGGQVKDSYSNAISTVQIGSFSVLIDIEKPTASLDGASPVIVTNATLTYIDFTVSYKDNTAIAYLTIGAADIMVIGPDNVLRPVTLVSIDQSLDGSPRLATYRFAAPTGTFNSASNGDYTIVLQSGQIADLADNFANAANLGIITVAVNDGVVKGVLTVSGTDAADQISITAVGTNYLVSVKTLRPNGRLKPILNNLVPISSVRAIVVLAGAGNDSVFTGPGVIGCWIDGGAGNDMLVGGQGNDIILGGQGIDYIYGGAGDDLIYGQGGDDVIRSQGGNDTIVGGGGRNQMFGGGGNDVFYANNGAVDRVDGGADTNSAIVDQNDFLINIGPKLPIGSLPPPIGPVPSIASPLLGRFSVSLLNLVTSSKLL